MNAVQAAFLAGLALATLAGRPDWRVPLIFAANLMATGLIWPDEVTFDALIPVAQLDFLCAAAFLILGRPALAGIYGAMPLAYLAGAHFSWPELHIHVTVEVLGILALGVIGRVDRGGKRLARWIGGKGAAFRRSDRRRAIRVGGVAISQAQEGRDG